MAKRSQRRHKAILPVRIVANDEVLVGHTLDISAHGARVIILSELLSRTAVKLEYKHRRVPAEIVWCRPAEGRKYEYELGLRFQSSHCDFWGVVLPELDVDNAPGCNGKVHSNVISMLSPKSRTAD